MTAASGEAGFSVSDGTQVQPGSPFFITGSGRCGTTLMRRLVVERTHAVVPPENYTLALSARLMGRAGTDWRLFCRLVLREMRRDAGIWKYFDLDEVATLQHLAGIPDEFRGLANFWHAFHAIYATRIGKPSTSRWGDKTPSNAYALPSIIEIFPRAKFIFMVRDVFDMSYSYGSMTIPGRHGQFVDGATRWVRTNERILAFSEAYPAQVIVVRYEELARSPDREMARVLAHLEVPTFSALALNELEARDIAAIPHLGNVLGDVSGDFTGKGRANLVQEVKDRIAAIAAPLQAGFGYEPSGALIG